MTYNKKRALSYGGILISVFLAYFCRLGRPENVFMRNLADQCRNCIYLGMYCAWVIYLEKHVVHRKTRRCLTAIGCLMVFWFFVRTVKFHIFHDPLGEHICWYLYYIPMILIPVLGLAAAMFLGEKDGEKTVRKIIALLAFAVVLIISVFTNDLHQLVFRFSGRPPLSDRDYSYGILFIVIQGWIIFCLIWMEIMLIRKSRIPGRKQFWLPVIPGILLLGWNIGNLLRLPLIKTIAGDMTAVCCLLMAAIYQGCILCGLIQTNNRYFELFQTSGGLDAEITDDSFQRYYHSGDFPELSPELRKIVINRSAVQEQGIRINHIPIRGGHLFWSEDISVLLDQYQDIREQQEELTARNRLLQKAYQKEAERRKTEEQTSIQEQLRLTDYEEIKERLDACINWLQNYPEQLRVCVSRQTHEEDEVGQLTLRLDENKKKIEEYEKKRNIFQNAMIWKRLCIMWKYQKRYRKMPHISEVIWNQM